jgi:Domain of unknown function (DUF4407)
MASRKQTRSLGFADAHSGSGHAPRGLLIWLSGADPHTLRKAPRERNKFTALGGVVLTTAAMAGVSCAFALHVGVKVALIMAIPIGLLWALAIMNLDRWLVTASPRRDRWYQNLYMALPRLVLAVIIGGVISTPLVLWIFQREINAELEVINQQNAVVFQQQLNGDERYKGLPALEAQVADLQAIVDGRKVEEIPAGQELARLRTQYKELDDLYNKRQQEATCERDGTCGTGVVGAGAEYLQKQKIANDVRAQRDAVKAQLDAAEAQSKQQQAAASGKSQASASERLATAKADLERLKASKKLDEDSFAIRNRDNRGLLAQLSALSRLTGDNGTLRTAYLALLLFITAIEVLPVLVKFLMNLAPASPYDRILAENDRANIATATIALTHEQDLAKQEWQRRAQIKTEILDEQMDAWRAEERYKTAEASAERESASRTGPLSWLRRERPARDPRGYAAWPKEESYSGSAGGSSPQHDAAEQPWTYDR